MSSVAVRRATQGGAANCSKERARLFPFRYLFGRRFQILLYQGRWLSTKFLDKPPKVAKLKSCAP
eukprot:2339995-Rhodomonas_salina.2